MTPLALASLLLTYIYIESLGLNYWLLRSQTFEMSFTACHTADHYHFFLPQAAFDAALQEAGSKLMVVDFSATWCGPCKMISPKFEVSYNWKEVPV